MPLLAASALVLLQGAAAAAPAWPGAHVGSRPVGASLAATVTDALRQPGTHWIGWSVPAKPGHPVCCSWNDHACRLDAPGFSNTDDAEGGPLQIMLKVEAGRVTRVRPLSETCRVDARDATITWLSGVTAEQSVAWLGGLAATSDHTDEVMAAMTFHAGSPAVDILARLARTHDRAEVRRKALFWLAQEAGQKVRATLDEAVTLDPETEVKKHAVFALSQLPPDEAIPALIRVAETHANPRVREKAVFWLGQTGDSRALSYFEKVLSR